MVVIWVRHQCYGIGHTQKVVDLCLWRDSRSSSSFAVGRRSLHGGELWIHAELLMADADAGCGWCSHGMRLPGPRLRRGRGRDSGGSRVSFGVGEGWMVVCATTAEASERERWSGRKSGDFQCSTSGRRWDRAARTITRC